jgi:hypothetical protein
VDGGNVNGSELSAAGRPARINQIAREAHNRDPSWFENTVEFAFRRNWAID